MTAPSTKCQPPVGFQYPGAFLGTYPERACLGRPEKPVPSFAFSEFSFANIWRSDITDRVIGMADDRRLMKDSVAGGAAAIRFG